MHERLDIFYHSKQCIEKLIGIKSSLVEEGGGVIISQMG